MGVVDRLPTRTGRPRSPVLTVRLDPVLRDRLTRMVEQTGARQSDVVRLGIEMVLDAYESETG